jgi:hypothetical protein
MKVDEIYLDPSISLRHLAENWNCILINYHGYSMNKLVRILMNILIPSD